MTSFCEDAINRHHEAHIEALKTETTKEIWEDADLDPCDYCEIGCRSIMCPDVFKIYQ